MTLPIDIVLVRPARPANVAAACRALKNMGLRRLVLVSPPSGLSDPEARALAYGAWDVLDAAAVMPDLSEAVGASTFVVGTTGKSGGGAWTPRQLAALWRERAGPGRMAVVFGPEASGLTGAELGLCHETVRIPTDSEHSSLNLAQAVLVVAYELRVAERPVPSELPHERAGAKELEDVFRELRDALVAIGYLNAQNPEAILAELRRLVARAGVTPREAALLRGLARQIRWAGSR